MRCFDQKEKIHLLSLHSSCENSSYNLAQIEQFLRENQYEFAEDISSSDIVIINTCAYSDQMQLSNEKMIHEIVKAYPQKMVLVFGCLVSLTSIKEENNLLLIGNSDIPKLGKMFNHCVPWESCPASQLTHFDPYQETMTKQDSFVRICQGCCNNCSYCNIKLAKGAVKSRPIGQIKEEVQRLIRKNVFEITLLADDCGSYGQDIGSDIVELMSALASMDGQLKFKIYTIFPTLLLRYYQGLKPFFEEQRIPYICLPLQSASSRVLKLMNRNYDIAMIKEVLTDIKRVSPDTYLFTHFMINFPDESVQDFQESIALAKFFDSSLFLPYQENRKTLAAGIVPKGTREGLSEKINMLKYCINQRIVRAVLVENQKDTP